MIKMSASEKNKLLQTELLGKHPQSYSLQKFNISILRKWHSVLQQTLLQLHFNWNLFIKVLTDFSGFIHNMYSL